MMFLFFALLLSPLSQASVESHFQVAVGGAGENIRICVLDFKGIRCIHPKREWDKAWRKIKREQAFKRPRAIGVGYYSYLTVIDDEGMWAEYWRDEREPGVTAFSSGEGAQCFIQREMLNCSAEGYDDYAYSVGKATELAKGTLMKEVSVASHKLAVTIDVKGHLIAWGRLREDLMKFPQPKLVNPRAVGASYADGAAYALVLDDEGLKVWGQAPKNFTLNRPSMLSTGIRQSCAIDDSGVKCAGDDYSRGLTVPPLVNPVTVAVAPTFACAVDDSGLHCWGSDLEPYSAPVWFRPSAEYPGLHLDQWQWYIELLAGTTTGARSVFYDFVRRLTAEDLGTKLRRQEVQSMHYLARYLASAFLAPAVNGGDSAFYREKLIPRFLLDQKEITAELNLSGIGAVGDNAMNRRVALSMIQSALSVGLNFFPPEGGNRLRDLLRLLGMASENPMDGGRVKEVVKRLADLSEEKEKLLASRQTAFLVETMDLATNWLQEKVK